jgi:hypothetical protein
MRRTLGWPQERPDGPEKVGDRHSSGARPGAPGHLRPVDHVDIAIDRDNVAPGQMIDGPVHCGADPVPPNRFHGDDEIAGGERIVVHPARIGEAGEADLGDVLARKSILHQRPHRIAVA